MLKSFLRLFSIYRDYWGRLAFSQLLLMISALSMVGMASLIQRMINEGLRAENMDVIIETGIWMVVLALISGLTMAGTAAYAVFFAQGTAFVIRTELYRRIQTFSFGNFDRFRTGNLMVRLNADVNNIMYAVTYMVMLALYAPFMVLAAMALAAINTPSLLWVLPVAAVVVLVIMAILVPQIDRAYSRRQERLDALNNTLQENLTGVRVVKAFVREQLEIERFRRRADSMRQQAFAAAFRVALLSPLLTALAQLASAIVIWIGGERIIASSGLSLGELLAFTQYLTLVVTPLALMAIVVPFILRGDTSARRIFEVYDDTAIVQDGEGTRKLDLAEVQGRLVFENVTFAFRRPDGQLDPPVLKKINLTIEPGEQVGFLGATGAGKSALVNLIPRFYDVTEGSITIDGIDVRDIPQENLRRIVGIALQEALLFQGDVRFNLKFGQPDVEDEVMVGAARAADAYGFVDNLPEQWSAPVARRGNNFSGGQRQRLCISRTLTSEPRILVLDDSTSALDVATESRVQEAIPKFTDGVTTLYVAQRISAVIDLDKIVLMDAGEIVAQGNHEELMETSPLYQQIYESQLGGTASKGSEDPS